MDPQPPLVVDLDGTLVRTDMLHETLVGALQRSPWLLLALPLWLMRGRAALKRELAQPITLAMLKQQKSLAGMRLLARGNRLSVMPISAQEWRAILALE